MALLQAECISKTWLQCLGHQALSSGDYSLWLG